ncbi:unnamed protein product [Parajaminaea phylloscopi]
MAGGAVPDRVADRHYQTRSRRHRRASSLTLSSVAVSLLLVCTATVEGVAGQTTSGASATWGPRWGQASALVSPLFLVYGGKTQGSSGGGFTYTSGPSSSDLFSLDLSQPFQAGLDATPPWRLIPADLDSLNDTATSAVAAPVLAYGSLGPLTHRETLLFGGDGSPVVPVQTRNDSAYTFQLIRHDDNSTSARWSQAPSAWAQPSRRIYQTVESDGKGGVWVIGGAKADGSGIDFDEAWSFNSSTDSPVFEQLAAPPNALVGATSSLLSDGSLLVLGGQDATGQLLSFESVSTLDTTTGRWTVTNTTGATASTGASGQVAIPLPRRNHIAVTLPGKRIFLHGGSADASLSTALSDAWILDWGISPPVWSQLNTSSSAAAPSARFGHSAVAYGRNVVLTLGWNGNRAADGSVYIFDATSLVRTGSDGEWSGGSWTSTYVPDPQVASSAGKASSANNAGGNGSSTSSGASNGSSSPKGDGSASPTTGASPFRPSASNGSLNNHDGDKGASGSVKAGVVIGALVGCGLAFAAGYFLYQRHQDNQMRNYRSGDGAGALLGGASLPAGAYPFTMQGNHDHGLHQGEKEKSYLAVAPALRPAGPRAYGDHREAEPTTAAFFRSPNYEQSRGPGWPGLSEGVTARMPRRENALSPSNTGLAREGSGPGMRHRLALLAGLTSWGAADGPRFDMLADEDEEQASVVALRNRSRSRSHSHSRTHARTQSVSDDEGDDHGPSDHVREKSYGRLAQYDPDVEAEPADEDSFEYENGRSPRFSQDQPYAVSPFEDAAIDHSTSQRSHRPPQSGLLRVVSGLASGALNRSQTRGSLLRDQSDDEDDQSWRRSMESSAPDDTHSGPSSHSHQSAVNETISSRSSRSQRPPSVSDISHNAGPPPGGWTSNNFGPRRQSQRSNLGMGPGLSDGSGSLMKRSPTWWDRFMSGTGIIERTASGRTASSARILPPIRDPAPAPDLGLSVIKESPRSMETSEDNPFADVIHYLAHESESLDTASGGTDDLGRKRPRAEDDDGSPVEPWQHDRSLSSLHSARTAASSHLEARLRGMDVVQRTRTGSSRHTTSSHGTTLSSGSNSRSRHTRTGRASQASDSTSGGPLSRMGSISETAATPRQYDSDFTPGQVVWRGPGDWEQVQTPEEAQGDPHRRGLFEVSIADETPPDADESMDITAQVLRRKVSQARPQESLPAVAEDMTIDFAEATQSHTRVVSEVPSITPATTKRARLNPALTSPIRETPPRSPGNAHLTGAQAATVRERVEAIERLRSLASGAEEMSPVATSPVLSPRTSPSSLHKAARDTSRPPETGTKRKTASEVSHGLVPKAQLFVANPDDL